MFVFEASCGGDSTSLLGRKLTVLTGRKFFLIPEPESKSGLSLRKGVLTVFVARYRILGIKKGVEKECH